MSEEDSDEWRLVSDEFLGIVRPQPELEVRAWTAVPIEKIPEWGHETRTTATSAYSASQLARHPA